MNKTEFEDKYPDLKLKPVKKDMRLAHVNFTKRNSPKRKYPHKIGFKKQ